MGRGGIWCLFSDAEGDVLKRATRGNGSDSDSSAGLAAAGGPRRIKALALDAPAWRGRRVRRGRGGGIARAGPLSVGLRNVWR